MTSANTIPGAEKLTDDDVILVTGGTGLFGKGIESNVSKYNLKGKWIFCGSKHGDLRDKEQCEKLFSETKPTYVLHLAAFVGGLFRNMKFKPEFWIDNVNMNNNVLSCCHKYNVKKTVSCLSTCVFPDKVSYPIVESALHEGPPHDSNNAYAYAKRMLDYLGRWFNERIENETGVKSVRFTSVIPTNLFGPHDNFNLADGHVLPGLMHKAKIAIDNNSDFVVYGTGKPLRQFLYSLDAGHMAIWAMLNYENEEPVIISVGEEDEISIADAAKVILDKMHFKGQVKYDTTKSDGQYKKTASNDKFKSLYPDFKFTPFDQAVEETTKWFLDNFDTCRK